MKIKKNYIFPRLFDFNGDVSKNWYVRYSYLDPFTGRMKEFRIKKGLNSNIPKDKREKNAKEIINELHDKLQKGFTPFDKFFDVQEKNGPTFRMLNSEDNWIDCLNKFLSFKLTEQIEEDSIKVYRSKIRKFAAYLEEKGIEKYHLSLFTYDRACDFFCWLKNNGCQSNKTLREYKAFLSMATQHFILRGIIKENVFSLLPKYHSIPAKPKPFSDSQLQAIKNYCLLYDRQLWTICQFILYCFFRPNKEVRLLRARQIDWERGLLISDSATSKNNKSQAVIIPPHFLEYLKKEGYQYAKPDDYLFTTECRPGQKPVGKNYIRKHFKNVQMKFNLTSYLYALKHTGNIKLQKLGTDLIDQMKQNRHSTPNMTYEYLKSLQDDYSEKLRNNYFIV